MRIHLERDGTIFEFERKPMPERRFKALCGLTAAGVYAGMVAAVTALCGSFGLLVVSVATLMAMIIKSAG